ncbi:nucleotide exchange factor GrpE [Aeromicrobium sp. 9AM]|uniref:nucleotide exchange factor GrpE n=1 Tax=Aeromicrobium sp. 9AM TaxID=2653126 RepID=UPI0012F3C9FB|nr:nucleotide exchange factor GrpE [Aeromicrobium sp. 9AM]VXC40225.1 Protein GrpE [Aeromicrobium sp. 9AM]
MTQPDEGSAPEQEASTSSAGETPVEPVETPAEPETSKEPTLEEQLAERTADLQRLQAEYVNYKRRVDRDRELVRAQGEAAVLQSLLTVLDDIARADEHGELEGGFKAVADALQQAVAKHKLQAFGAEGEPFDPAHHEAVFHAGESAEVETTTVHSVMRTGYKHGERVLRPATVGVVDPAAAVAPEDPSTGSGTGHDQEAEQDVLTDEAPDE